MDAEQKRARVRAWYAKNRERLVAVQRKRREANHERTKAYCRKWYAENKEKCAEKWAKKRRESYAKNRDRHSEYWRRKLEKARAAALSHYGVDGQAKCRNCGIEDVEVLVLDHINNDGNVHRRKHQNAKKLAFWVVKHGFPEGFQTLCHNCNYKKRLAHLKSKRPR